MKEVPERPHEALDMKCPADVFQPSTRPYRGIGELSYPFHDRTTLVTHCGRICIFKKKINLSQVFAGQAVGIKEVHDDIWLVSFMDYDLGYFDLETRVLEPLGNPFGPKVFLEQYGVQLIAPHKFVRVAAATQDGRVLRRYRRRWKVERLFAWLHNFRRVVIRWEYYPDNLFMRWLVVPMRA